MSARPRLTPPTDATLAQALAWPGPGRTPTAAHPLCRCQQPVDYPPRPDIDFDRFHGGQEQIDYIREEYPRRVQEWREACEAARLAARCVAHDRTPSVWSMRSATNPLLSMDRSRQSPVPRDDEPATSGRLDPTAETPRVEEP